MANDIITKPYLKEVLSGVKSYVDGKGAVPADAELSDTSENAVQNKAVKAALDAKADKTAVPTKVSQLSNDSGYLTKHQDISSLATKAEVDSKLTERLGNVKVKRYKLTNEQIALNPANTTLDSYAPQGNLEDNTIYILDNTEHDSTKNVISYFVCDGKAIPLTRQTGDTTASFDGNSPADFATIKAIMDYVEQRKASSYKLSSLNGKKLSDNDTLIVDDTTKSIDSAIEGLSNFYVLCPQNVENDNIKKYLTDNIINNGLKVENYDTGEYEAGKLTSYFANFLGEKSGNTDDENTYIRLQFSRNEQSSGFSVNVMNEQKMQVSMNDAYDEDTDRYFVIRTYNQNAPFIDPATMVVLIDKEPNVDDDIKEYLNTEQESKVTEEGLPNVLLIKKTGTFNTEAGYEDVDVWSATVKKGKKSKTSDYLYSLKKLRKWHAEGRVFSKLINWSDDSKGYAFLHLSRTSLSFEHNGEFKSISPMMVSDINFIDYSYGRITENKNLCEGNPLPPSTDAVWGLYDYIKNNLIAKTVGVPESLFITDDNTDEFTYLSHSNLQNYIYYVNYDKEKGGDLEKELPKIALDDVFNRITINTNAPHVLLKGSEKTLPNVDKIELWSTNNNLGSYFAICSYRAPIYVSPSFKKNSVTALEDLVLYDDISADLSKDSTLSVTTPRPEVCATYKVDRHSSLFVHNTSTAEITVTIPADYKSNAHSIKIPADGYVSMEIQWYADMGKFFVMVGSMLS